MKGLPCYIFEEKSGGNCSAGGISGHVAEVILVGRGIPEIFDADEGSPAVEIKEREINGKIYYRAVEVDKPEGRSEMFGGCFIYTSDSRFPFDYPIPLHDRYEQ